VYPKPGKTSTKEYAGKGGRLDDAKNELHGHSANARSVTGHPGGAAVPRRVIRALHVILRVLQF
jgi:hypothetical protein